MNFKKNFSAEEIEELCSWFNENADTLPESLQLDKSLFIKDLKHTIKLFIPLAKERRESQCFNGQIFLLFKIREKVLEDRNQAE